MTAENQTQDNPNSNQESPTAVEQPQTFSPGQIAAASSERNQEQSIQVERISGSANISPLDGLHGLDLQGDTQSLHGSHQQDTTIDSLHLSQLQDQFLDNFLQSQSQVSANLFGSDVQATSQSELQRQQLQGTTPDSVYGSRVQGSAPDRLHWPEPQGTTLESFHRSEIQGDAPTKLHGSELRGDTGSLSGFEVRAPISGSLSDLEVHASISGSLHGPLQQRTARSGGLHGLEVNCISSDTMYGAQQQGDSLNSVHGSKLPGHASNDLHQPESLDISSIQQHGLKLSGMPDSTLDRYDQVLPLSPGTSSLTKFGIDSTSEGEDKDWSAICGDEDMSSGTEPPSSSFSPSDASQRQYDERSPEDRVQYHRFGPVRPDHSSTREQVLSYARPGRRRSCQQVKHGYLFDPNFQGRVVELEGSNHRKSSSAHKLSSLGSRQRFRNVPAVTTFHQYYFKPVIRQLPMTKELYEVTPGHGEFRFLRNAKYLEKMVRDYELDDYIPSQRVGKRLEYEPCMNTHVLDDLSEDKTEEFYFSESAAEYGHTHSSSVFTKIENNFSDWQGPDPTCFVVLYWLLREMVARLALFATTCKRYLMCQYSRVKNDLPSEPDKGFLSPEAERTRSFNSMDILESGYCDRHRIAKEEAQQVETVNCGSIEPKEEEPRSHEWTSQRSPASSHSEELRDFPKTLISTNGKESKTQGPESYTDVSKVYGKNIRSLSDYQYHHKRKTSAQCSNNIVDGFDQREPVPDQHTRDLVPSSSDEIKTKSMQHRSFVKPFSAQTIYPVDTPVSNSAHSTKYEEAQSVDVHKSKGFRNVRTPTIDLKIDAKNQGTCHKNPPTLTFNGCSEAGPVSDLIHKFEHMRSTTTKSESVEDAISAKSSHRTKINRNQSSSGPGGSKQSKQSSWLRLLGVASKESYLDEDDMPSDEDSPEDVSGSISRQSSFRENVKQASKQSSKQRYPGSASKQVSKQSSLQIASSKASKQSSPQFASTKTSKQSSLQTIDSGQSKQGSWLNVPNQASRQSSSQTVRSGASSQNFWEQYMSNRSSRRSSVQKIASSSSQPGTMGRKPGALQAIPSVGSLRQYPSKGSVASHYSESIWSGDSQVSDVVSRMMLDDPERNRPKRVRMINVKESFRPFRMNWVSKKV